MIEKDWEGTQRTPIIRNGTRTRNKGQDTHRKRPRTPGGKDHIDKQGYGTEQGRNGRGHREH